MKLMHIHRIFKRTCNRKQPNPKPRTAWLTLFIVCHIASNLFHCVFQANSNTVETLVENFKYERLKNLT